MGVACVEVKLPELPELGLGLSLSVELPSVEFDATLCCKLLQFELGLPPIDLGISLSLPIFAAVNAALGAVQAYIDALPLECPKQE